MTTLSTFTTPVEAALAKTRLDDRGIFSALADENVNQLGGAPFAMPIRLLVADEQLEEARRILREEGPPLSAMPDFETDSTATPESANTTTLAIQQLRRAIRWLGFAILISVALSTYLAIELPARTADPWAAVTKAYRRNDFPTALRLAEAIVAAHPKDFYGHEYLGSIYRELGNFERAENEYMRALELMPPQRIEEKLEDVRKRRAQQEAAEHPIPGPTRDPIGR